MSQRREIVIRRFGAAGTLSVSEAEFSAGPGPDEVTVDVAFSGINFADIMMRLGFYPDAPPRPFVPGYEISGTVSAVGSNVADVAVGERVVAGTYFGGYASRVKVPRAQVLPLPEGMSLEQGAALPVNFFTAHLALFEMARVRSGDRVLIDCATGGVGTLAVQMAREVGADVVGLTTSPHKLSYIEELGAAAMTRQAFHDDPGQRGFDFILNSSGGADVEVQRGRLGITGRMVCIGLSSGLKDGRRNLLRMGLAVFRMPRIGLIKLINQNVGVYGLNALKVLEDGAWVERLTAAFRTARRSTLEPHVDEVFEAERVAAAHEYIQTKQARGKILLGW
jgi:NADPH:quinone reductase-like Zn-dependent oxidoreductase